MIKCLGMMCVKGGHWFTNGCYVGQVASLAWNPFSIYKGKNMKASVL